jgi:hypothetical protein
LVNITLLEKDTIMKILLTGLCLGTIAFLSTPAQAFNDWYRQGFADGVVYRTEQCSQIGTTAADRHIQQVILENQRLKQQLLMITGVASTTKTITTTGIQTARAPVLPVPTTTNSTSIFKAPDRSNDD